MTSMSIAIIDYGHGNMDSIARAVQECGGKPIVTSSASDIERSTHIILPGVGAFASGMGSIKKMGLDVVLTDHVINSGIPFLGICLGMQLLAKKGFEGGECLGLGWINAEVKRLEPEKPSTRIPHVGWNEVQYTQNSPLFIGIPNGKDFYFTHSYHMLCNDQREVFAVTQCCGGFVSVVGQRNIWGVQFHPEKSQKYGFQLLRNFVALH